MSGFFAFLKNVLRIMYYGLCYSLYLIHITVTPVGGLGGVVSGGGASARKG